MNYFLKSIPQKPPKPTESFEISPFSSLPLETKTGLVNQEIQTLETQDSKFIKALTFKLSESKTLIKSLLKKIHGLEEINSSKTRQIEDLRKIIKSDQIQNLPDWNSLLSQISPQKENRK